MCFYRIKILRNNYKILIVVVFYVLIQDLLTGRLGTTKKREAAKANFSFSSNHLLF